LRKYQQVKYIRKKLFWVATFIGGALVSGYLFFENFKTLGQNDKVKNTWLITIVSTIVIIAFFIFENVKIPKQLLPITYSAIAYGLFTKYQADKVEKHLGNNGRFYNWSRIIGVSIIGLMVTLFLLFIGAFISDIIKVFI